MFECVHDLMLLGVHVCVGRLHIIIMMISAVQDKSKSSMQPSIS